MASQVSRDKNCLSSSSASCLTPGSAPGGFRRRCGAGVGSAGSQASYLPPLSSHLNLHVPAPARSRTAQSSFSAWKSHQPALNPGDLSLGEELPTRSLPHHLGQLLRETEAPTSPPSPHLQRPSNTSKAPSIALFAEPNQGWDRGLRLLWEDFLQLASTRPSFPGKHRLARKTPISVSWLQDLFLSLAPSLGRGSWLLHPPKRKAPPHTHTHSCTAPLIPSKHPGVSGADPPYSLGEARSSAPSSSLDPLLEDKPWGPGRGPGPGGPPVLLVKIPLINLSILRSRVDARPPSRPLFSPGAGGSRVIGGAGPRGCVEAAVTEVAGTGITGTVSGGEPALGPGCKSLLSKVLLLLFRGDNFPLAPAPAATPPEVVTAAPPPAPAATAETPVPAVLFDPLTLGLPSLSGHDRRLPAPLPPPALAPLVVTVLKGLGAGGGGATLSRRLPVPGCGEDEPGTPPPVRPSGSGPPQLGLLRRGRREEEGAPPGLESGLSPPESGGPGGAAHRDSRRPGAGETGRAGLAGAGDSAGGSAPPAPALLVLIHSASCRWKRRSCRFLPGSSAPRGLPGSRGSEPLAPGAPAAAADGEGGGGGTDSSLTRVSEMR